MAKQILRRLRNRPDMSSLTPTEIGQVLAMSLDQSCGIAGISPQLRGILNSADIPLGRYHEESVLLAGFAQDYGITLLLQDDPGRQADVLAGYRDVWSDIARRSPEGSALYQKFLKRCPEYARAAIESEPGSISKVALAFGEFLSPENANAQVLALSLADSVYLSHFQGTAQTLRRAGILAASETVT